MRTSYLGARTAARRGISAPGEQRVRRDNNISGSFTCDDGISPAVGAVAGSMLPGVFSGGGSTGPEVVVEIIRLA